MTQYLQIARDTWLAGMTHGEFASTDTYQYARREVQVAMIHERVRLSQEYSVAISVRGAI